MEATIAHFNIADVCRGLTETDKGNVVVSSDEIEISVTNRRKGALHFHNATEVVVVLEGQLEVRLVDGRIQQFEKGDVIVIPSPLLHATGSRRGAMMMTIRKRTPRK